MTNLGCWFEIPSKDISKSMAFYQKSFDVQLKTEEQGPMKMAMFPYEDKAEGASGALVNGPGYSPSKSGTLVYFEVKDIDGTLNKISSNGGKTLMPKTEIGKYGFIAQFEDLDGNHVGLHSM